MSEAQPQITPASVQDVCRQLAAADGEVCENEEMLQAADEGEAVPEKQAADAMGVTLSCGSPDAGYWLGGLARDTERAANQEKCAAISILERARLPQLCGPIIAGFPELAEKGVHFSVPQVSIPASTPRVLIVSNWDSVCGRGGPIVGALYDALLLAKVFRSIGFEVLFLQNATSIQCYEDGVAWLIEADHGVFYFAGHGGSFNGSQILAAPSPDGARGGDALKECSIKLDMLIAALNTPDKTRVMLIDCCRDSNLSPDIKPQVAAQLPMTGMFISSAALCGQVVAELPLKSLIKYAEREPTLWLSMPELGAYADDCKRKDYEHMHHSTYSLFLAMRLMQDKDASLVHLMRQMRNDSLCVLAHRQAEMMCASLLNPQGKAAGIPGGITFPLDTSSLTENLTMLGKVMPEGKITELVDKKLYISQSPVSTSKVCGLVIGNEDYQFVGKLPGAARDARDMAETLRALGVEVTEKHDLTGAQILEAVADFAKSSAGAGVQALVYYAGHGFQVKGHNLLAGVDVKKADLAPGVIDQGTEIPEGVAPLTELLNDALSAFSRLGVIVDACRDDPFANSRSLGKPLETSSLAVPTVAIMDLVISTMPQFAQVNPAIATDLLSSQSRGEYNPAGSSAMAKDFFTLFSSSPAEKAKDGGSYTQTLLKELTSVEALRDLEDITMRASHKFVAGQGAWSKPANGKQNKQVPWSLSILLSSLHLPECTPEILKQIKEKKDQTTAASINSQLSSMSPESKADLLAKLLAEVKGGAAPAAPATEVLEPAAKVAKVK